MFAWLKSHFFSLAARANVFAGPPDFGPDRRPFLSLADELQDRCSGEAERNAAERNGADQLPVYRYDIVTRGPSETPFFMD